MGNCHEAETNLDGMYMNEKITQIVYIVYGTPIIDKKNPSIHRAFKSIDDAREFAKQYPCAYIKEVNLHYEKTHKFYPGDPQ